MALNQIEQNPEGQKLMLLDLDEFLERDRELFDLPPKTNTIANADHSAQQGQPDD